ncbi:MAG: hypothetical protein ACQEWV_31665 [Bacillota bacterium]
MYYYNPYDGRFYTPYYNPYDGRSYDPYNINYYHNPYDQRYYYVPRFPEPIYYTETGYHTYRQIEFSCEDAARINAVADYSEKKFEPEHPDHLGAFPNFEEGVEGGEHRYQLVLFYRKSADYAHALKSEFGNINRKDFEAMMLATDRYAKNKGYNAGIPNFHEGPNDYGVFLFKNEAIDIKYFSLNELGNPRNVRDIFIAVNRKAREQGYESGFPTFTGDSQGRYKVALIKDEYAELRGVAARDLNLPEYVQRFCPPVPDGPNGNGDELVTLTKTIGSFHYPVFDPLPRTKLYRVYLEVKVPKSIADSTQQTLDGCMEVAKIEMAKILAPYMTPATYGGLLGAIPGALVAGVSEFTKCVASDPRIYPHIDKIQVDIKTNPNA